MIFFEQYCFRKQVLIFFSFLVLISYSFCKFACLNIINDFYKYDKTCDIVDIAYRFVRR